ncbi:MAG: hypothetical protein ACREN6_08105 [Gemmatimonadaceae bacterium]
MRRDVAALTQLCVVVFMLGVVPCDAQTTPLPFNANVAVRLTDGSVLVGRLAAQTVDSVMVITVGGGVTVARRVVSEISLISDSEIHEGTYWPSDPNDTRVFFGPTGRTLAAGTGYISDVYLLLLNGAWGFTDRFTLGAGMSLVPLPQFFRENVYYVAPKIALVRGETFNLAAGALVGFSGEPGGGAFYYLAATNGHPDASFTYGAGYAYAKGAVPGDVTLMLSGNRRVARKLALMTENYIYWNGGKAYWAPIYGVRFIGDRLSTDLGLVNQVGHDTRPVFPGVPWLGFALKF